MRLRTVNAFWFSRVQSVEACPTAAHPRTGGGEFLFDFQRTSLAGLALDSATSSGLGEPPLCNAGPHPGTTWNYKTGGIIHQLIEQPGHAG
ncbi:hypothetical protein TNCV_4129681 [Trichonephila clavipes]|nr:hypothetical protein TNCV_4129681 [Trichonephila clavipes]